MHSSSAKLTATATAHPPAPDRKKQIRRQLSVFERTAIQKLFSLPTKWFTSTDQSSMSASAIWHSLRELVSSPEVWLAQCLCESNQSLPYRKLVESAKAEKQRIRIGTSQGASIDGENLNTLGRRQLFGSS